MQQLSQFIEKVFGVYAIMVRYLISGATSVGTDLIALYILKEYFQVFYLSAAIIAFLIAFVVSFLMMKYWTFQDGANTKTQKQLVSYFAVSLFNLLLNSILVWMFVEKISLWYIMAQILASLIIAVWSFFVYKYFIFIKNES